MKREQENGLVLTTTELYLCMNLLGRKDWEGFPVLENDQPLEQRLLESFFRLVEMGLLEHQPEGYAVTEELTRRLHPAAWPQRILTACSRTGTTLVAYQEGDRIAVIQQVMTEEQSCRVLPVEKGELAELMADETLPEGADDEPQDQPAPEELSEDVTLEELLAQSEVVILVTDGEGTPLRLLRLWRSGGQLLLSCMTEEIETAPYSLQTLDRLLWEGEV